MWTNTNTHVMCRKVVISWGALYCQKSFFMIRNCSVSKKIKGSLRATGMRILFNIVAMT